MVLQLAASAIAGAICWYWGYWYGRRETRRQYERVIPLFKNFKKSGVRQ